MGAVFTMHDIDDNIRGAVSKKTELLVHFTSASKRQKWLDAYNAVPEGDNEYVSWNCPQVQALYDYEPRSEEELRLAEGQIINVVKRDLDGWSRGHYADRPYDERTNPDKWFPANYVTEKRDSAHAMAQRLTAMHSA